MTFVRSSLPRVLALTLALSAALPGAAAAAKKSVPLPDWNDPTVHQLGAHPVHQEKDIRHSQPPAPIRGVAEPKVEAGTAVIPGLPPAPATPVPATSSTPTTTSPSSAPAAAGNSREAAPLPSAARPSVQPEGAPAGAPAPEAAGTAPPPVTTGFWHDHPFASGMLAGLIGTTIGETVVGGEVMGSDDGVMTGYGIRVGFILLPLILLIRWAMRRQNQALYDEPAPRDSRGPSRREPSFDRHDRDPKGRREPSISIAPDERRSHQHRR